MSHRRGRVTSLGVLPQAVGSRLGSRMTKNPFLNALAAVLYIVVIVFVMHYATGFDNTKATVITPMAVLLLFTLSAAVMGYLFLYQPLQIYTDGERKVAINLFLQTVAVFAVVTVVVLLILFSRVLA